MSKKMPDRFMETGDAHVASESFTADELNFLKSEDDEEADTEEIDGPQKEDLRYRTKRSGRN